MSHASIGAKQMNVDETIHAYLSGLELGDAEVIVKLFTTDAVVISPLYGRCEARKFYERLFSDTAESRITCRELFVGMSCPEKAAAHFDYEWRLSNGKQVKFECVDIFEFDLSSGKIRSLAIIYDSRTTRGAFEELKARA